MNSMPASTCLPAGQRRLRGNTPAIGGGAMGRPRQRRRIAPLLFCECKAIQRQSARDTAKDSKGIVQTLLLKYRACPAMMPEIQSVLPEPVIAVPVLPLVRIQPMLAVSRCLICRSIFAPENLKKLPSARHQSQGHRANSDRGTV